MTEFDRQMGDICLYTMLQLSDQQMEQYVRDKFEALANRPYTDRELYDLFVEIAKIPVDRLTLGTQKVCCGDVSGFVQAVCDVTPFYTRPEEGEAKPLDREWCAKQLHENEVREQTKREKAAAKREEEDEEETKADEN